MHFVCLFVFFFCYFYQLFFDLLFRVVCNKILMKKNSKEMVEWGYCFDVHLNAFVPLAVTVFGIQMVLVIG